MTDNTNINSFQKQKNKEEMKKQLITFALMIGFTIIAFAIVATEAMDKMFAIPLLLILAVVQVAFQFYYFMHMKDKGHEFPSMMIYGGIWAAILTVAALVAIVWW
ncbi:cytochrome c oxidase subunit IVB [Virgibacillus sp. AGTR]|uniref:Cytochrome c oxidase subunit IVB n=1 Tax=Virgibacillus salarius TaxID=447199 RepID=A0A941E393_9BACI|nr:MULTISPECIES: cytochrome c oxidase subunit IVB [Virgibacillus]NAZ10747.1 cytochrome c oxidase subunit IVB [Agaribacter marinus]MBR7798038.1 cytochrome c oxidase subunit IVB [Virgibacillus salarius]MCC2249633.1 cytochrome c oxidase subunit IVB [Virgibacillus sp. AGTR]MDY7044213.1 cytochrome c oxidase subunit IVB [Virgibacillus sp. M23]QRZ16845.1 cytochrome c oxidase subunit IVB [Virgibacillus sp. AGTR]